MMELGSLLTYLVFALLTGGILLHMAPKRVQSGLNLKLLDLSWLALCIPVVTFIPLWDVFLSQGSESSNLFQWERFIQWNLGQAWLASLILSIALCYCLRHDNGSSWVKGISIVLLFLVFVAESLVSHPAVVHGFKGMAGHLIHLCAVSVWMGALLVSAFFIRGPREWMLWLRWFTPIAVISVLAVSASGLWLVPMVTTSYVGGWGMTYGQLLLVKHVLFFGVLTFAIVNSFFLRRKLRLQPGYEPQSWLKAEGCLALFMFVITAWMSNQPPPHDVSMVYYYLDSSTWFQQIFTVAAESAIMIQLYPSIAGIIFVVCGVLLLTLVVLGFKRGASPIVGVSAVLLAVCSLYTGAMVSIEVTALPEISESTRRILQTMGAEAFCH